MQFRTILQPRQAEYCIHVQYGGRPQRFDHFAYELHDDPKAEGITVRFGPRSFLPREFWPDVAIGARLGGDQAWRGGIRLCCVGFTMTSAVYHDVDTTSFAIHRRVSQCVCDQVTSYAEPVPPFRAEWLTSDVVALARGIHANAALDGLPALTDALLDAGCDDPLAIEHLKTCPDHGPMCWVVEMICTQAAARG
jgi:hypothetical protein